MQIAKLPDNEAERIEALNQLSIMDTMAERFYDDMTKIASELCNTSIALLSFVDSDRQWFKSKIGLDVTETSRDMSFCAHAILEDDVFIVEDVLKDDRFADNPLVTGEPGIRSYAGIQIRTPDGLALGTLCVIDQKPMKLSESKIEGLAALGRQIECCLGFRKQFQLLKNSMEELEDNNSELMAALDEIDKLFSLCGNED